MEVECKNACAYHSGQAATKLSWTCYKLSQICNVLKTQLHQPESHHSGLQIMSYCLNRWTRVDNIIVLRIDKNPRYKVNISFNKLRNLLSTCSLEPPIVWRFLSMWVWEDYVAAIEHLVSSDAVVNGLRCELIKLEEF